MTLLSNQMHLFFAKEGKVEQNFERLCVSSQDDEFCDTTVKCFCRYQLAVGVREKNRQDRSKCRHTFVSSLLQLLVLSGLLNKLKDLMVFVEKLVNTTL